MAEDRKTLTKSIKDMKREGKEQEDLARASFAEERETLTKSINDMKEGIMALTEKVENAKNQESHIEQIIKALTEHTTNEITNVLNEHTRKIAVLVETAKHDQAEFMKGLLKAQIDNKESN